MDSMSNGVSGEKKVYLKINNGWAEVSFSFVNSKIVLDTKLKKMQMECVRKKLWRINTKFLIYKKREKGK